MSTLRAILPSVFSGWVLDGVQALDSYWTLDGSALVHGSFSAQTADIGAELTITTRPAATWTLSTQEAN